MSTSSPRPAELGLLLLGLATVACAGLGAALTLAAIWPMAVVAGSAALVLLAIRRWSDWHPRLWAHGLACGLAVDRMVARRPGPWIALAAAAGVFAELVLIRWHATSFQLFSYFKNVSLIACFLGLGIGYARAGARPLLVSAGLPAMAVQIVLLRLLSLSPVQDRLQSPVTEQLALGLLDEKTLGHWLLSYGVLAAVFLLTVLTCVPLGQLAGRTMRAVPALRGYAWNLAGSLAAVGILALLAHAWSPPELWLLSLSAMLLPFLMAGAPPAAARAGLASLALALGMLAVVRPGGIDFHSPYQLITLRLRPVALAIETGHAYFQTIWDLRPGIPRNGELAAVAAYYDLPYAFVPRPRRVLIAGSGAGNDVAAALRAGASAVDAVEIDPVILDLGRRLHPERPYRDSRVRAVEDDARSFLRRAAGRYDLIVFGLLDSHASLTGGASVRLDSYVYTVEAFREAVARLDDDGVLVMSFTLLSREIAWKLYLMLREATGTDPLAFETLYDGGITFVAGPGLARRPIPPLPFRDVSQAVRAAGLVADVSRDDWPFLYMPVRRYPVSYLAMAALLLVASAVVVRASLPDAVTRLRATPFALGAGFMLIETKAITQLALVFGSTWQVVSVVLAGVLAMAFVANLWVSRRGAPSLAAVYGLIALSLLAGLWARPTDWQLPRSLEQVAATVIAVAPLLFAGAAFSRELADAGTASEVLASNLQGAVVGGLIEYNVLYLGVSGLTPLALGLYGLAFWTAWRRSRSSSPGPAG